MAATTRAKDLVERELGAIASELADEGDRRYAGRLHGAEAGLRWLLGQSSTAPVSGRLIERPQPSDAYSEALWADEVTTGVRAVPHGLSRDYAGGVASGLLWALGRSAQPPAPLGGDAPMRERSAIEQEYEANLRLAQSPPSGWFPEDIEEELGVVAVLGWLLGKSSSPISGRDGGQDRAAVTAEMEAAQALTPASTPSGRVSRHFAGGVYDALRWALELTDRQPGPD